MIEYRLTQHLGEAHESRFFAQTVKETINKIDTESKQYIVHAKIKCRNIKLGQISFSPESTLGSNVGKPIDLCWDIIQEKK